MINCAKSLELLSDFRDDALNEKDRASVSEHLATCLPCTGVFQDIDSIIITATILRREEDISFPDENALWQRMRLAKSMIH